MELKLKERCRKSVSKIFAFAPYFCDRGNADFTRVDWLSHNF